MTPQTPLIVHHLNNSRSQRILWLLEELGLPYEVVKYQRDAQTMLAPPELRRVHPLGKSPVVTVDGLTLAESGAIIETLVERYGNGRLAPAPGTPEAVRCRYWLHYAEGSAMPPLLLKLIFDRIGSAKMPFFAKPVAKGIVDKAMAGFITPQLRTHLGYMESELQSRDWFAGGDLASFDDDGYVWYHGRADDMMNAGGFRVSPLEVEAAQARGGLTAATHPRLIDWLSRIRARPAYQRAVQRGGEDSPLS